ncbi:MAG: hypothetical protein K2Q09_09520, partial [Phycisphaerales bacterium]|nr:hypothetical protein [Phycisphaerales bacterium]
VLLGGDFGVNPWCRGTTFAAIANTLTYTADRFFAVGGASPSINVSRQAIAAGDISNAGNTFAQALQFARTAANANTAVLNLGQVLESTNSIPLQGSQVTLSFWAKAGANFSAAGGFLGVQVVTGTGTDQSAANLVAGSWTGQSVRPLFTMANGTVNIGSNAGGNPTTGLVGGVVLTPANGVPVTTVWQRFQLTCSIPANATQIGVLWNYTPVGTAGANDWVQFAGMQLEQVAPLYPFASAFEYRRAGIELMLCQRYATSWAEPAATVAIAPGQATGAAAQKITLPLATQMRVAPTVTIPVAGTFRINVAGTPTAVTLAGATSTPSTAVVTGGATNTAGQAVLLEGNGGAGLIVASAEL